MHKIKIKLAETNYTDAHLRLPSCFASNPPTCDSWPTLLFTRRLLCDPHPGHCTYRGCWLSSCLCLGSQGCCSLGTSGCWGWHLLWFCRRLQSCQLSHQTSTASSHTWLTTAIKIVKWHQRPFIKEKHTIKETSKKKRKKSISLIWRKKSCHLEYKTTHHVLYTSISKYTTASMQKEEKTACLIILNPI